MKIGVISDLHIDANDERLPLNKTFAEILANKMKAENVDFLLLAGDISNDYHLSLHFLDQVEQMSNRKILFTPGNHDYWSKENKVSDTWKIYQTFKEWDGCIDERAFHLNDEWVVIGGSGWYDHSFGDASFTKDAFNKMNYMNRTWHDSLYVDWGMTNKEIHYYFYEKMENELQKYKSKNIIMMTHMVTHPHFIVANPNEQWKYFNAFLGSTYYQDLYKKYNVQYGIMGHVHYRRLTHTEKTKLICACLGNHSEWKSNNVENEIDDAFYSFII